MRCSTCGDQLLAGEDRCPTCGAVANLPRRVRIRPNARRCPRCGHHSEGGAYFGRVGNLALLVGLSVFTWGVGGLIYYASCRRRRVCPSCGLGWEHSLDLEEVPPVLPPAPRASVPVPRPAPAAPAPPKPPATPAVVPTAATPSLPSNGIGRRVVGVGMGFFGSVMIVGGIAGQATVDGPPILLGSILGMMGSGLFLWGWRSLQERRRTVLQDLARKVLIMATARDGVLTVTEVAAELELSLGAAEKLMEQMDDGFRVRSDVSDEGVIYYEFPEVVHRDALRAAKTRRGRTGPSVAADSG